MTWVNRSFPVQRRIMDTGLTLGSSTNSHSSTLAAPARAPGM